MLPWASPQLEPEARPRRTSQCVCQCLTRMPAHLQRGHDQAQSLAQLQDQCLEVADSLRHSLAQRTAGSSLEAALQRRAEVVSDKERGGGGRANVPGAAVWHARRRAWCTDATYSGMVSEVHVSVSKPGARALRSPATRALSSSASSLLGCSRACTRGRPSGLLCRPRRCALGSMVRAGRKPSHPTPSSPVRAGSACRSHDLASARSLPSAAHALTDCRRSLFPLSCWGARRQRAGQWQSGSRTW